MKNARAGSRWLATLIAALGLALCAASARAAVTWTNTAGSWNVAANWSPNQVPTDGDDVVITNTGASVLLAGSSSNLSSLLLSKTLTFTNWDTKLTATNVTILSGGNATCIGPFTNNAMSNRVYLAGSNITIDAGGQINVTGKGWAGGIGVGTGYPATGNGPGGVGYYSGGGYGNRGQAGGTTGGSPYGSLTAPEDPGSGGGGEPGWNGGDGGGAVRIQATGQVTVNGTIVANATGGHDGGGSGGGIYIACDTFVGTSGTVSANGVKGGITYGAGGRCSVVYNYAAQSLLAKPRVTFSVGPSYRASGVDAMGTLYFPDDALLDPAWLPHIGMLSRGSTPSAWTVDTMNVYGNIRLTNAGYCLTVSNNLNISGADAQLELGGDIAGWAGFGLESWPSTGSTNGPTLTVGGDLNVTNSGSLVVYGGVTNAATTNYGALVEVAGTIYLDANSWIYPYSNPTNGGSPLFRTRNLNVDNANCGFNADTRGFAGGNYPWGGGYGPGYGGNSAGYGGSGHSGYAYGSSNAPIDPGSGCRAEAGLNGRAGGGLIHIEASENARLLGKLTANGAGDGGDNDYGSSGGGIYLRCKTLSGSSTAQLLANGGSGYYYSGGGRIAVWRAIDGAGGPFGPSVGFGASSALRAGRIEVGSAANGTVVYGLIPILTVTAQSASQLGTTNATMNGTLVDDGAGAPTEVAFCWGGYTDAGTGATGAWQNVVSMGSSLTNGQTFSSALYTLIAGSSYVYRCYATNASWGGMAAWSDAISFAPQSAGANNDGGAANITATGATLRGVVVGDWSPNPEAYICWGAAIPGNPDSTSAWDHVESMGQRAVEVVFSTNITGLLANNTYYYRCFATNASAGGQWAPASTNFLTASPAISISNAQVTEGPTPTTTNCVFAVTLSAASAVNVTVDYASSNGTATAGSDYNATNGTLTILAGQASTSITVVVIGDNFDEFPSETFYVNLSLPVNATIAVGQATGTIIDDDDTPEVKVWTGTGNWLSGANWSPAGRPSPSDDAIIQSGSVLLSNSQSVASLTVTNSATLTFTNWDTKLTASNVTILSGGKVTCIGPFTNNAMSNRVYLAGSNITIDAGGSIDVNARGFSGGILTSYPNPGHGPGGGGNFSGGGYGNRGQDGGGAGGSPYGSLTAPEDPGSGGGGEPTVNGGHGGGAVRINASGQVTVNGTITANATGTGDSYGSGGGIYITCNTFAGTSGVVNANGGVSANGDGAGGRCSVVYNYAAQSLLAKPRVTFSVSPSFRSSGVDSMGTLYFPDDALLDPTWLPHIGQLSRGSSPSAWTADTMNVYGNIRLTNAGFRVTIANNLNISGAGAQLELGGDVAGWAGIGAGWPSTGSTNGPTLSVGGNLNVTNSGQLVIYAGVTNVTTMNYCALVEVAGTIYLDANSWICPNSNPTNGGSPLFRTRNLNVDNTNCGFNANGRGFAGGSPPGYGPGYGPGTSSGSAYGGRGESTSTYGSSNAPIDPGSGATSEQGAKGPAGGGLIRIEASGEARILGILTANGAASPYPYNFDSSGGGIYLRCYALSGASTAQLLAKGGSGGYWASGGGRIAVWRAQDGAGGPFGPNFGFGTNSALKGTCTSVNGANGTVVYGMLPLRGAIFKFR